MTDSTIETCPKHGIEFNRAHYRECELCRGPLITALQVEAPFSPERMRWIKVVAKVSAAVLGCALVAYVGTAPMQTKHAPKRAYAGSAIVGMPCVHSCADRAEECYLDCASVRMDSCADSCMPEMAKCERRCDPQLQAGEGIAVISSELAGPDLDHAMEGIYSGWPVNDRPGHALVRLTINRNSGTVHSAEVQAQSHLQAELVASTWKRAVLPKATDPRDNEPGRHDALAPYVIYLVMTL
jgi:hypothetical protein